MKNGLILIIAASLTSTGCEALLENVDAITCAYIPSYVADCLDPEVHDKAVSVLTDGAVEAQIECLGIAIGPGGKVASVYYNAAKLQDGSCFATANVTGPAPAGGGFVQSTGSKLTRRSDPDAAACPVTSFHVPQLRTETSVTDGVIRVEGPFCTNTSGYGCTMPVATNCTGLNIDRF